MILTRTSARGFDPDGPFGRLWLPLAYRQRIQETRFKQRWQLTLEQYAALMSGRPVPAKRKQRGSIIMAAMGTSEVGIILLTAHSDNDVVIDPSTAIAGFTFQRNGTLGRTAQADISGEWWSSEPKTNIGDGHEVRALAAGKVGTWTAFAAADDAWITIGGNRTWTATQSGVGVKTTSATFEVGVDGVETAVDSATLTAVATVDAI